MKLGRLPAKFDSSVPKLESVALKLNSLPAVEDRWKAIQYWPMLLNDTIGDCTIAGVGHVIEYWNIVGQMHLPTMTDLEAEVQYQILGNYNPKDPLTDNGCIELDVLKYFNTHGIMAASEIVKIDKFVSVAPQNLIQIKTAIHQLGNCYFGYNLPSNAMQTNLWSIDTTAQIIGGHAINAVGYDDTQNLLYIVSWGTVIPVTYDFHMKYCEEAWSLYNKGFTN